MERSYDRGMIRVDVADASDGLAGYLESVEHGETVVLCRRSVPGRGDSARPRQPKHIAIGGARRCGGRPSRDRHCSGTVGLQRDCRSARSPATTRRRGPRRARHPHRVAARTGVVSPERTSVAEPTPRRRPGGFRPGGVACSRGRNVGPEVHAIRVHPIRRDLRPGPARSRTPPRQRNPAGERRVGSDPGVHRSPRPTRRCATGPSLTTTICLGTASLRRSMTICRPRAPSSSVPVRTICR